MADLVNRVASLFGTSPQGVAGAALGQVVGPVTIRTQFTPDITFNPFESLADGTTRPKINDDGTVAPGAQLTLVDQIGLLLKPEVQTSLGTFHPYGAPSGDFLPHLLGVGVLGVAALGVLLGAKAFAKNAAIAAAVVIVAGEARRRLA